MKAGRSERRGTRHGENIFLELGFPVHLASAMLLRAQLAEVLRSWMEREALTQAHAARRLGISRPKFSKIVRGMVERMSLEDLVGLCAKAGLDVALKCGT